MISENELIEQSDQLLDLMKKRRTVRAFSKIKISRQVIENCIAIAATAPSGANMQPWTFVLVEDPKTKKRIRKEAETVEKLFYEERISEEWRLKLKPLGTNPKKEFLTQAPFLICIFAQTFGINKRGKKIKHYYVNESVGIATGFLISSLHQLGISSLTYTPAPMSFLNELLDRPGNERPFMILAVGYPHQNFKPPRLKKKDLDSILIRK
ncbi:MAG: nitroreductase family protein [Ignavibacteriales bacterium]|nr:MAG: nitroreductase family protein [Ignavibacteriales bacterium]